MILVRSQNGRIVELAIIRKNARDDWMIFLPYLKIFNSDEKGFVLFFF